MPTNADTARRPLTGIDARPPQGAVDEAPEERIAVAHGAGANDRLGHQRDGQDVHEPEHDEDHDPGKRPERRERDRQREDRGAHGLGERERVGEPEGRKALEALRQGGPCPAESLARAERRREDDGDLLPVEVPVRGGDRRVVEAEGGEDARRDGGCEAVLVGEAARERRLQPRVARHERRPLLRVPLEIVDADVERCLAGECERLHECEGALLCGLVRQGALEPPPRLCDEARRPRLDQEEERRRALRGRAGEELLPVEEAAELVVAHQRASCAVTFL